MTPYRAPAERGLTQPPRDLVYLAAGSTRRSKANRKLVGSLCFLALVSVPLWFTWTGPWLSIVLLLIFVARWQVAKRPEVVTLRIHDFGQIEVVLVDRIERRSLDALLDVELDNKVVAQTYAKTMVGAVEVATGVQPEHDVSRIVMVFDDGLRLRLGDDYEAYTNVAHALGKIRVFLRRNGWLPDDERQ